MDHIKYYSKIKDIPTVDLSEISEKNLFHQRTQFYLNLGISKLDMQGKEVLELCPGTGYNSFFLLKHFKVKHITLIDFNSFSIEKCKKNLQQFKNKKILKRDLNIYKTKKKYDYIIFENAIDAFKDSKKVFKKVQNFLKKDGMLILMVGDKYGIFSMKLRYLVSVLLTDKYKISSSKQKLKYLSKLFKNHLNYLSKNSRNSDKWVKDNILNEDWIRTHNYFDIMTLKKCLSKNCLIKSIHPKNLFDFSWYKQSPNKGINQKYFNSYEHNKINFLDFETQFYSNNKRIDQLIKIIISEIKFFKFDKEINKIKLVKIKNEIKKLEKELNKLKKNNKISLALNEIFILINSYIKNKKMKLEFNNFNKFWGSYNQQVLILKKN